MTTAVTIEIRCSGILKLSASAMSRLSKTGLSNVIYTLAKGVGTKRSDGSDSCFPSKRMTMGLVEYAANFFAAPEINTVRNKTVLVQVC